MVKIFIILVIYFEVLIACPKVISLAPSITETIEYIDKGKCLIATTVYTKDSREKIGGIVDPDIEKIISLKPDMVIATTLTPSRIIRMLEYAGIKVIVVRAESIEDVERNIKIMGEIFGIKDINKKIEVFRSAFNNPRGKYRGNALIIVGCDNLIVAGRGTYLSQIFGLYGLRNVALKKGWYRINMEYIYKIKPEYIFTFCDLKISFPFRTKIIKLSKEKFLHPSPILLKAMEELEVILK